jgi:hypothetical protein
MDLCGRQARGDRRRGLTDEDEETKARWLQSGLREWSNYWTDTDEP